jgi:hypothetical protein
MDTGGSRCVGKKPQIITTESRQMATDGQSILAFLVLSFGT